MTERISRTRSLLANVGSLRLKAEELKGLEEKISNLKNSARLCDERYVRVNTQISELQAVEKLVKDKEKELEGMRLSRQHAIDKLEGAIKELKAKVRRLADYRCDATGASSCPFLMDAREAKKTIPAQETELQRLTVAKDPRQEKLIEELADLRRKCAVVPSLRKEMEQLLSTKRALADEMQKADQRAAALKDETQSLAEVEQAGKELPGLETELAALKEEKEEYLLEADRTIAAIGGAIRSLEDEAARIVIDPTLKETRDQIVQNISGLSSRIDGDRLEEARLRKEAGPSTRPSGGSPSRKRNASRLDEAIEHFRE